MKITAIKLFERYLDVAEGLEAQKLDSAELIPLTMKHHAQKCGAKADSNTMVLSALQELEERYGLR